MRKILINTRGEKRRGTEGEKGDYIQVRKTKEEEEEKYLNHVKSL